MDQVDNTSMEGSKRGTTSSPFDPDPNDLALSALRQRERRDSYRKIGEILGVSKGTAHRLVQRGYTLSLNKAHVVMRAPGREPGTGQPQKLLDRLQGDFERVCAFEEDFADPVELREHRAQFGEGADLLAALITKSGSKRGLKRALTQLSGAFFAVLSDAQRREVFAAEVNSQHVADVFREDALRLGAMISPRAALELPRWVAEADARPSGSAQRAQKLSRQDRESRNLQILLARAQSALTREIAARHNISERQVRRVLAEQQAKAQPLDLQSIEALAHEVRRACRQFVECGEDADDPLSPSRFQQRFALMNDAVALLRDVGAIPAGGLSGVAWDVHDRSEVVSRTNRRVRALLEAADVDPELIDQVTDAVIAEALPELAQMEADIVQP